MGQDAWRAYVEMALGMTEASRKKATKAVRRMIGKGGATAEQLQGLAEELLHTSAANRDALTKLVRFELERALGKVGLATAEEVNELTARVRELEGQLREARAVSGTRTTGNGGAAADSAVLGSAATNGAAPATALGDSVAAAVTTPAPVKKVARKAVRKTTGGTPAGVRAAAEPTIGEPAAAAKTAPAGRATAARKTAPAKKVTAAKKTAVKTAVKKAATGQSAAATKAVPARSPGRRTTTGTTMADTGTPNPVVKKAPAKRTGQR
jgi:polyhydroxyalkanoate synthesis regulator phasin